MTDKTYVLSVRIHVDRALTDTEQKAVGDFAEDEIRNVLDEMRPTLRIFAVEADPLEVMS
jgi:hypothetical protein